MGSWWSDLWGSGGSGASAAEPAEEPIVQDYSFELCQKKEDCS